MTDLKNTQGLPLLQEQISFVSFLSGFEISKLFLCEFWQQG